MVAGTAESLILNTQAATVRTGESQSFSASYDSTTKIISAVVIVLFAAIAVSTRSPVVAVLEAVLLIVAYGYSPRGYSILDRTIVVNRLIGDIRVPLDGVRELRTAAGDDLQGCIRLFGSGGLFGWYGVFRTSKLGKCTWYVTNRGNAVVAVTGSKTVVFSPDDADGFVAAIQGSVPIPQIAPSDPLLNSLGSYPSGNFIGKLIGGVFLFGGISLAAFTGLYAPGPPGYTLTSAALTIHDRFYPVTVNANSVDVNHIRIVDLAVDTDWQPTRRTNGFSSVHYRSGWFRVAGGKTIRLYSAHGKRLVLLPGAGNGTTVLLETQEPEKFVREVRQEWANHS
jgi:Bacterial PH domain